MLLRMRIEKGDPWFKLRFETKIQDDEGTGPPMGDEEDVPGESEKGPVLLVTPRIDLTPSSSFWDRGGATRAIPSWLHRLSSPQLSKTCRLTMLLIFKEVNAMPVVLEKEDEMKLRYLTSAMTTLQMFGKSTYATWIHFG